MLSNKKDVNILVVEDDKALADNLVEYLSNLGYSATATYEGRDGLRRFEQGEFKLDELEVIINRALERHSFFRQLGVFRGLTLALIISVPFWLILGIVLALVWK